MFFFFKKQLPSGTFISEGRKKLLGTNTSKDKLILLLAGNCEGDVNQNCCWCTIPEPPGPSGNADEGMACYMVSKLIHKEGKFSIQGFFD